ncbi:phage tail protein [Salmonella enterica]|uniref:Phage tail protein n=2 Tax=Salmonella enterica TaxID=28901 RepID=A0A5Y3PVH4_SALER|nr:phage tail protein [Salmonella enterica]EBP3816179.1 phage tail protein [Salmonella enterica subsp. enterica]ECC1651258.1 phage tail protein [Salmonella enterica subsp. arizonae]ECP3267332.1 phage tail protein [Salmonella enterica subsp. enterica serovar [1],13,23:g,z51:-]ECT1270371.1 phage tail protein [Salmonella enterica subsp. houtenae serovar 48:g,z51:-]ECT9554691.1 phage tail protein [Salmonella enterica subsp. arizonae serovar 41:z4,z23:-]ECU8516292.1 phage tail protein [Salmonella 
MSLSDGSTGCDFSLPESGVLALTPDERGIAENAPEKIDTFTRKTAGPSSGHYNGCFFCTF